MQRRDPDRRYDQGRNSASEHRATRERYGAFDRYDTRDRYGANDRYDTRDRYGSDTRYGMEDRPGSRNASGRRYDSRSSYGTPPKGWGEPEKKENFLLRQLRREPVPLWLVICIDVLALAVALNVYALFHHAIPRDEAVVGITASVIETVPPIGEQDIQTDGEDNTELSDSEVEPTDEEQTEENDAEPASTSDMLTSMVAANEAEARAKIMHNTHGDFTEKFAGHFTSGEIIATVDGYQSANLHIINTMVQKEKLRYYVADIYIRDINCLTTVFGKNKFGKNHTDWPKNIAKSVNAVMAINGDFYGLRVDGVVIRNGMLYRDDSYPLRDLCVLYYDGTMETLDYGAFDATDAIERGAYQSWNFGPKLLDDSGMPMTEFNTDVRKSNPRTAIGYYEPGHYCFVVVDGRSSSSAGMTIHELSQLMYELGCTAAYNLDGGQTSEIVYMDNVVNKPYNGGRKCSDIIALCELP